MTIIQYLAHLLDKIGKKEKKKKKTPFINGRVILRNFNSIEMGGGNTRVDKHISFKKICVNY
jgi:hypothetical protein